MKNKLKLKFVDFWTDMNQSYDNILFKIIQKRFDIEISNKPDLIITSCFGNEHLKYTCPKIHFITENNRPDFKTYDFILGFDRITNPRFLRYPLWLYYLQYFEHLNLININTINQLDCESNYENWLNKPLDCCILVSNEKAKERIQYYYNISKNIHVASAGMWNNNVGRTIPKGAANKLNFIKDYKFVISFENSSHEGYITEKILEPFLMNSIPIYWGANDINKDFNEKSFIKVELENIDNSIQRIQDLLKYPEMAKEHFQNNFFSNELKINAFMIQVENTLFEMINQCLDLDYDPIGNTIRNRYKFMKYTIKKLIE
jgi:hypothetical protein